MEAKNWAEIQDRVITLYGQGRLREALEAANSAAEIFPERATRTSYWRACLYSLLGETQEALAILEKAVANGIWWSETTLLNESDLAPIRDTPEFREIVLACKHLSAAAQEAARPQLIVLPPRKAEGASPPPLLMALHSRGSDAQKFAPYWQPAADAGVVVAIPQSSQVCAKDEFCWDDEDKAATEVTWAYEKMRDSYRFDPSRLVLAGASQGGRIAITAALKGDPFQSRGFIAVVPAVRDIEGFVVLVDKAAARGIKGYIITGDRDQFYQGACRLQDAMEKNGLLCKLDVRPGMGHRFPPDFSDTLLRALDFILKGD